MVDILITIGILAFVLLRASVKAKKKAQQRPQRKPNPYRTPRPVSTSEEFKPFWEETTTAPTLQEKEVDEQTSYEEIPKNNAYFTYESLEPEINVEKNNEESSSLKDVEMNVQNIERENEKSPQFSLDKDEIIKGVIFSEILKRPYN